MEIYQTIVETPARSNQKYQYDRAHQTLRLVKMLPQGMHFPFDFGYFPNTHADDGDPVDVLLLSECSTFPGCAVDVRIVGALVMEQSPEPHTAPTMRNDRFIAVPVASAAYKHIHSVSDLPDGLLAQLIAFFQQYLALEEKQVKLVHVLESSMAKQLHQQYVVEASQNFLYELFIPLQAPDRQPFPRTHFSDLRDELITRFGGLTIYQRTPVKGIWENPSHVREGDDLIIYEVMTTEECIRYWQELKRKLEQVFQQTDILIRQRTLKRIQ
ncbi:inorganic diphosphatase [Sphingobacterium suaedae]|uniref:inorganic diphosphatase n=1 Tax=Sphingobacterium suaedae TaxID=1686402 RepID=A0ABW5KGQ6_9SPHI